jgi:CHAT domain-containing protein
LQAELAALALALLPAAVRRHLATGRGRLVVVPHDVLFHLPFGAMPVDDCLLGDRWEVALAPSAGCWLQLDPRRDADPDSLPRVAADQRQIPAVVVAVRVSEQVDVEIIPGVADSVEGLAFDPLEGTLPEAKAVLAEIGGVGLLGPQALKPALQPLLRHARILHLATHGYWHVLGENSFLVLAGDSQPAGANALFARDVLEEPMQAELVVLSACQTGLGAPHPDSYLGLPQAFNIAGARAVLASLWPVDDEATRRLMAAFYGELARGATPAVALQVAQRALRVQSDTASGACWAAFQFQGWPFRPMETAVSTGQPGDAAAKFAGPEFCGGDFLWTDGQPGQALPLTALEPFRLKWDEAVLLAGHTLKVLRKY